MYRLMLRSLDVQSGNDVWLYPDNTHEPDLSESLPLSEAISEEAVFSPAPASEAVGLSDAVAPTYVAVGEVGDDLPVTDRLPWYVIFNEALALAETLFSAVIDSDELPDSRVVAEDRVYRVAAETRSVDLAGERRQDAFAGEDRNAGFGAEGRGYEITHEDREE